MILKFFKNEKFPGTIDTLKLCGVNVRTSSHEHYPAPPAVGFGRQPIGDYVEYIDLLLDGGQTITIESKDALVINRITVKNDSEANAIRILEFLNSLLWLEHDDTYKVNPNVSIEDALRMDREGSWPNGNIQEKTK